MRRQWLAIVVTSLLVPAGAHAAGVCAAKTIKNAKNGDFNLVVLVLPLDVSELLASGFVSAPCGVLSQHLPEYKAMVCNAAAFGNDAVQARFTDVLGVAPAKLCSSATSLLNQAAAAAN